ncbi:MAG: hypothetical protein LBL66_11350 [Clostridiales bacterium]|jgi:hypothetical protein|nr:hypothetical protein [Clostridiales bacterium]
MTERAYKTIDTLILTSVACALEAVNVLLMKAVKNEIFTLSVTVPIALIVMVRWKWPAAVAAVAGGLTYCLCNAAAPAQYLVYGLGNAGVMLNLLWFKSAAPGKIRGSLWLSLLFALTGFLSAIAGRAAVSMIVSFDLKNIPLLLASDALNVVIGLVVIAVARKQNGLFEAQPVYLARMRKEAEGSDE